MKANIPCTCLLFLLATLTGCVSTIQDFNSNVTCPVDYSFHAPFEKTWNATVSSLLELGTVDEIDRKSSTITSGISVVEGRDIKKVDPIFGQIVKYSFHIKLYPEAGGRRTHIITDVTLFYKQLLDPKKHEIRQTKVEHYLRDKLYREICRQLFPKKNGPCWNGFDGVSAQKPLVVRTPPRQLEKRQIDAKVQFAQRILGENGYNPGPSDGLMGRKTVKAFEDFQRDNGLAVTGVLNTETYEVLSQYKDPTQPAPPLTSRQSERQQKTTPPVAQPEQSQVSRPAKPKPSPLGTKATGKFSTTDSVDLLKEEDLYGSDILDTIPANTTLRVISKDSEYYKVIYKRKEGYVYGDFVQQN